MISHLMLGERIFLSVVNYCHTAAAPFLPENDGERKLTRLQECDLVMYLMHKRTCLTVFLRLFNFRGYSVGRSQLAGTRDEGLNLGCMFVWPRLRKDKRLKMGPQRREPTPPLHTATSKRLLAVRCRSMWHSIAGQCPLHTYRRCKGQGGARLGIVSISWLIAPAAPAQEGGVITPPITGARTAANLFSPLRNRINSTLARNRETLCRH